MSPSIELPAPFHCLPSPLLTSECLTHAVVLAAYAQGQGACVPVMFPGSEDQVPLSPGAEPGPLDPEGPTGPGKRRAKAGGGQPPKRVIIGTSQSHPGPWACAVSLMENTAT